MEVDSEDQSSERAELHFLAALVDELMKALVLNKVMTRSQLQRIEDCVSERIGTRPEPGSIRFDRSCRAVPGAGQQRPPASWVRPELKLVGCGEIAVEKRAALFRQHCQKLVGGRMARAGDEPALLERAKPATDDPLGNAHHRGELWEAETAITIGMKGKQDVPSGLLDRRGRDNPRSIIVACTKTCLPIVHHRGSPFA